MRSSASFSGIADEHDCAFELAHHTRKQPAGSTAEYAMDDIRGASGTGDAVRAARVLNRMSQADAEAAAIGELERLSRFRVDRAKGNYSAPARPQPGASSSASSCRTATKSAWSRRGTSPAKGPTARRRPPPIGRRRRCSCSYWTSSWPAASTSAPARAELCAGQVRSRAGSKARRRCRRRHSRLPWTACSTAAGSGQRRTPRNATGAGSCRAKGVPKTMSHIGRISVAYLSRYIPL